MPRFTDIYITVPNEEKKSVVEMVFLIAKIIIFKSELLAI